MRTVLILCFGIYVSLLAAQDCLPLPAINGSPCEACVPPGWTNINSSDLILTDGSHPIPGCGVGDISGPSPSGGTVMFFVGLDTYVEGITTTISGLNTTQEYSFGLYWEMVTTTGCANFPGGSLEIVVDGQTYNFSGATDWQLAEFCFMPSASTISVTISIEMSPMGSIVVDIPNCSQVTPCCALTATPVQDTYELCPNESQVLGVNVTDAIGPVVVNWTSIPAIGITYLDDITSLNPTFNLMNSGAYPGETFTFTASVQDNACMREAEIVVTVNPSIIPEFDFTICKISEQFNFPTTSLNGYSGTWSGDFNLLGLAGTTQDYVFTLDPGQSNCLDQWTYPIYIELPPLPFFIDPPADITVSCSDMPIVPGSLSFTNAGDDGCNISGAVLGMESGSYNNCGGSLEHIWLYTDDCNRTIFYTQNIEVLPAQEPTFQSPPADITIDCNADFPIPGNLSYVNFEFGDCEIFGFVPGNAVTIDAQTQAHSWLFINPCSNVLLEHTQFITQLSAPDFGIDFDSINVCLGGDYDLSLIGIVDPNGLNPDVTFHAASPAGTSNELSGTVITPVADSTIYILLSDPNSGCATEIPFVILMDQPVDAGENGAANICFNQADNIDLFALLNGSPETGGNWSDLSGSAVDLNDPTNISLTGLTSGIYQYQYTISGNGNCPADSAIVTLDLLQEIDIEVLTLTCAADLNSYEVIINTNGYTITSNIGTPTNSGINEVTISGIPIADNVEITATDPGNLTCMESIMVMPPVCSCGIVDPPINDGDAEICFGENNPVLSVSLGPNQIANWYDSATGGALLIGGSNTFTPTETAVGVYQYYVESQNSINLCNSFTRTEITFEILPILEMDLVVTDEVCGSDENGQVVINSTGATAFSLNGIDFFGTNTFDNLAVGPYTAYVSGPGGCDNTLDFSIAPGVNLSISDYAQNCDDNGTPNDPGDDFYTIDFIIENDQGLTNSYDIFSLASNIGNGVYGQLNSLTFPADGTSPTLDFIDQINDCGISQIVGPLLPCSSNCSISISNVMLTCNDNNTVTDPLDDFYDIEISTSVTNPGGSNQFEVFADGISQGVFVYGTNANITLSADGNSPVISVQDIDIAACEAQQTIGPLDDCAQACVINATFTNVLCDDNGTGNDPNDDTFTFEVTVIGQNIGATWNSDLAVNGAYGTPIIFGPYLISAGAQIVNITDDITASCTTTITVNPPITCSSACDLNITNIALVCDDNNTITDPLDDFYNITISPSVTNPGPANQFEVFADGISQGIFAYGANANVTLPADGSSPIITVQDVDFIACSAQQDIGPLDACAQACTINATFSNILCNDNGTVNDPNDDTFTFEVLVTGQNVGATWSSDLSVNGTYGTPIVFGPYPISSGAQIVNITDDITLTCSTVITVNAPGPCSSNCSLSLSNIMLSCDDNNTITDPLDDFYNIAITTSIANPGSSNQFEVFADGISQGIFTYGSNANIILPADGSSPTIIVQDFDIPVCTDQQIIGPLEACAQACTISAAFSNVICDDNGTGNDPNDDTFTFEVLVTGQNVGATWSSDLGVNGTFNSPIIFGPYLINAGAQIVNISDDITTSCSTTITVDPPVSCSNCLQFVDAGLGDELSCNILSVNLLASSSAPGSYQWTGPGFILDNSLSATVTQAGWYFFTATYSDNCVAIDSVEVTIDSNVPVANGGPDTLLNCDITMVTLQGMESPNQSGQWLNSIGDTVSFTNELMVSTSGNYYYQVIDDINGCGSNLDEVIVVDGANVPLAVILAEPSDLLNCVFETITLIATPQDNVVYTWDIISEVVIAPQVEISTEGTYSLMAIDTLSGCSNSDEIDITDLEEYPLINIAPADVITCYDSTIILDATNSQTGPDITYTWLDDGFNEIPGANSPTLAVNFGGIYYLQLENSDNGCSNIDTVVVQTDQNLPLAQAGDDIYLPCLETQTTLNLVTPNGSSGLMISWSTQSGAILSGTNTETPSVDGTGLYYVAIQNTESGCIVEDSILVSNNPDVPEIALFDVQDESCLSFGNGVMLIDEISGGTAPYTYTLNGLETNTSGFFPQLNPGSFTMNILDDNGCELDTNFVIQPGIDLELELPLIVELTSSSELGVLEGITNVDASQLTSIQWTPANLVSCEDCLTTEVFGENGQEYTLTIIYENGCSEFATTRVFIKPDADVFIPNAFSPNNDGNNDRFTLFANEEVIVIDEMLIFDRWGELIFKNENFEPNNLAFGWDGQMNGKPLNPGVFVYQFRVQLADGTERLFAGDLTLMR